MNNLTPEQIMEIQAKYNLSYHVNYAKHAEDIVGLKGQRVLEVGGSLPRAFVIDVIGAAEWTAIEQREYWDEVLKTGNVTGTPPTIDNAMEILGAGERSSEEFDRYRLLFGSIETLPDSLASSFDRIFSIAAFEHIARLPEALEQMYKALVPGGKLFSLFAPIWSSQHGYHLPDITDQSGIVWGSSSLPDWSHLLMQPMEMFDFLKTKCDAKTAREITYYVYTSPHINRFFLEDYIEIVRRSPFTIKIAASQWRAPVPEAIQSELKKQHPCHTDFSSLGALFVLERPP